MHTIRLRGPWELEPITRFVWRQGEMVSATGELPPAARQTMPADWSAVFGTDFLGVVRYCRTFQRPTNLEPHEVVWLSVEPPRSTATIRLNGKRLGGLQSGDALARYDITSLLAERNSLEIDVTQPALDGGGHPLQYDRDLSPGGLVGEVRLEIEG